MAVVLTDYGSQVWLNTLFGLQPFPAGYYVALLTGDGGDGFDGTELASIEPPLTDPDTLAATNYHRVLVPTGLSYWGDAEGGFTTNLTVLDYGTPTADWGNVVGWALCTDSTAGYVYAMGDFSNPQYVASGNSLTIPAGALTITMSGSTNTIVV